MHLSSCPQRSESEKNRRRDSLYDLRSRREQMQFALKRNAGQQDKELLFQGGGGGGAQTGPAASSSNNKSKETDATAALDARGLLQLQDQVWECNEYFVSPLLHWPSSSLPLTFSSHTMCHSGYEATGSRAGKYGESNFQHQGGPQEA